MKRIAVLLMSVVCCFVFFASCAEKKEEGGAEIKAYSFENSLESVKMNEYFGIISLNTDEQYVSDGKCSLKLRPMGSSSVKPLMFLSFSGKEYSNLAKVLAFSLDFYTDRALSVGLGVYFSAKAELRNEAQNFALKAGWNTVEFSVEHSLTAIQYDLAECEGLYVMFGEVSTAENAPSVYLDNIVVKMLESPATAEQQIRLKNTENVFEVADFEYAYQKLLVSPYSADNSAPLPVLEVVEAADYGLTAPSGKNVLRIENYPTTVNGSTWMQIFFSQQWLEVFDPLRFKVLSDYELKFDIYQSKDIKLLFELNFYGGKVMDWGGVYTQKGEWVEYSASLETFPNFFTKPEKFGFSWVNFTGTESGEFFLDNIRIEKVD